MLVKSQLCHQYILLGIVKLLRTKMACDEGTVACLVFIKSFHET